MNTKLCRPILVENKDTPNVGDIVKSKFEDIHILTKNDSKEYIKTVAKQQLILISLEDEKIKVGDMVLRMEESSKQLINPYKNCFIEKCTDIEENHWEDLKVIATQSQLSPEYIQQFIEEYNNDDVKDIEIEMEEYGRFNTINHPYEISRPKLTSGFVTIVEKDSYHEWYYSNHPKSRYEMLKHCYPNFTGDITIEMIKHIKEVFNKSHIKPILYTEEEVEELCSQAHIHGYSLCLGTTDDLLDFTEWFKQNKKK